MSELSALRKQVEQLKRKLERANKLTRAPVGPSDFDVLLEADPSWALLVDRFSPAQGKRTVRTVLSRPLLQSWVEQKGPTCAAYSVAAVLGSLGLTPSASDVLDAYASHFLRLAQRSELEVSALLLGSGRLSSGDPSGAQDAAGGREASNDDDGAGEDDSSQAGPVPAPQLDCAPLRQFFLGRVQRRMGLDPSAPAPEGVAAEAEEDEGEPEGDGGGAAESSGRAGTPGVLSRESSRRSSAERSSGSAMAAPAQDTTLAAARKLKPGKAQCRTWLLELCRVDDSDLVAPPRGSASGLGAAERASRARPVGSTSSPSSNTSSFTRRRSSGVAQPAVAVSGTRDPNLPSGLKRTESGKQSRPSGDSAPGGLLIQGTTLAGGAASLSELRPRSPLPFPEGSEPACVQLLRAAVLRRTAAAAAPAATTRSSDATGGPPPFVLSAGPPSTLPLSGPDPTSSLTAAPDLEELTQWATMYAGRLHSYWRLAGPRPSTSPIGTDRLMWALRETARAAGRTAKVWRFMSKAGGPRADVTLSDDDSEAESLRQWGQLAAAVEDPSVALLYHLENHYSPIYGVREWIAAGGGTGDNGDPEVAGPSSSQATDTLQQERSSSGEPPAPAPSTPGLGPSTVGATPAPAAGTSPGTRHVRQVLVGKPGQRPNAWAPWDGVRHTVLSWTGHCIIAVQLVP